MRLGVYSDLDFRTDGEVVSTDQAFIRFVAELPPLVEEVVVFGRVAPGETRYPYVLSGEGVRFVPLPHYPSVWDVRGVIRAAGRSSKIFGAELERLDAVWLFGPHPIAFLFALVARRRRVPLLLGVRQHYPEYIAARVPSARWRWTVGVAHALDLAWRLLARRSPTIAIGEPLAARYAGGSAPVLAAAFPLVSRGDLVPLDRALERSWDGELHVVSVGRLDAEKNPHLLLDAFERLRSCDARWRLAIVGDGPLRPELEARGVDGVEFLGYVPSGPALWAEYDRSVAFLHVSLTEGLPQVLAEAQAAGLPIVATDVGGVRAALGGDGGLLVPPRDRDAVVRSLQRLAAEPTLRERLIRRSAELAEHATIEHEQRRIVDFAKSSL